MIDDSDSTPSVSERAELTAGRELDALIAERVMGIAPEEWRYRCYVERHERDEAWCYHCRALIGDAEVDGRIPQPYSTRIEDAWLVVEKMRADGWRVRLDDEPEGWGAWFRRGHDPIDPMIPLYEGDVRLASMPHAICLAALAALAAPHGGTKTNG